MIPQPPLPRASKGLHFLVWANALLLLTSCDNSRVILSTEETTDTSRAVATLPDGKLGTDSLELSGKILDAKNNPLAGIAVLSTRLHRADTSRNDGSWHLRFKPTDTTSSDSTRRIADTLRFFANGALVHERPGTIRDGAVEDLNLARIKIEGLVAKGDRWHLWPSNPESLSLALDPATHRARNKFGFDTSAGRYSNLKWLVIPKGGGTVLIHVAAWGKAGALVGTSDTALVTPGRTDSVKFRAVMPIGGFRPPPSMSIQWVSDSSVDVDTFLLRGNPEVFNGETLTRIEWYYKTVLIGKGDTLRWHRPGLPWTQEDLVARAWFSNGDSNNAYLRLPYWKSRSAVKIDSIKAIPRKDSVEVFTSTSGSGSPKIVKQLFDIEGKAFTIPQSGRFALPIDVRRPGATAFNLRGVDEAGDTAKSTFVFQVEQELWIDSIISTPTRVRVVLGGRSAPTIASGDISIGRGSCNPADSISCEQYRSILDPKVRVQIRAEWSGGSLVGMHPMTRIDTVLPTSPPYKLLIDTTNNWVGMNPWFWLRTSAQTWGNTTPSYSIESISKTGRLLSGPVLQFSWRANHKGGLVSHVWLSSTYLESTVYMTDPSASGDLQLAYDNDSLDIVVAIGNCGTDADFDNGWMRGWKIPSQSHGEVRITPDSLQWFKIPAADQVLTHPKPPRDVEQFKKLMSSCYTFHFAMTCGSLYSSCGNREGILEIGDIQFPNPGFKP